MGVYSINSTTKVDFNNIEESTFTPDIAGAYEMVAENEANYNSIMKAVGIAELACLEATGAEMIYEAADIKGFFAKVKQFFVKIIEKIKAILKKFFALIDSFVKSDKDFVNKYKKDLYKVDTKGFEYEGFKFTHLDWSPSKSASDMESDGGKKLGLAGASQLNFDNPNVNDMNKWDDIITVWSEESEEVNDTMRGAAIGAGPLETSEFSKELFAYFRNGEDSKQTIDNVNISELLSTIENYAGTKKKAEKAYSEVEKEIKAVIKDLEKTESKLNKLLPDKDNSEDRNTYFSKALKVANTTIAFNKSRCNILSIVNNALLQALKDEMRQAKSVCVKLISYKPKNESTGVYSEGGFLSGVKLK